MGRPSNETGSINWKKFGARVGRDVKKLNMSYRFLAVALGGVSSATWHRIVAGKMACSPETYLWLCTLFNIDPLWAYKKPRKPKLSGHTWP